MIATFEIFEETGKQKMEEKTGEKFCIGPLSCACFKINSEIKYGITVEYEK